MPHALIIDDNLGNINVLQHMLAQEGLTSTAIQDAAAVESRLASLPTTDVVFIDLEMPDVSGYDIFHLLKGQPAFKQARFIACTVHTMEIHNAREIGFDSFLGKPLKGEKFSGQLAKIMAGGTVWEVR
ncbi:MAG: response regulator [Anaerolineales bacterium]|nr:response regulator [Anaerolineales bacterium]